MYLLAVMSAALLTSCNKAGERTAAYDSISSSETSDENNAAQTIEETAAALSFLSYEKSEPGETAETTDTSGGETEEAAVLEFSSAEEAAESFIEGYYRDIYLCEPLNAKERVAYKELAEYIETKIGYRQERAEKMDKMKIEMELRSTEESGNSVYMVYFVEVSSGKWNSALGRMVDSGFGNSIQIVVEKNADYKIRDFFVYDFLDNLIRDAYSISADGVFWEVSTLGETAVSKLKEFYG